MKTQNKASKIMISTFVIVIIVLLGYFIHNSMNIGLYWQNDGANIFQVDYSIENSTVLVSQTTLLRQPSSQYSMYLYLLYVDDTYQGYYKAFSQENNGIWHNTWRIPISSFSPDIEKHTIETRTFVVGPKPKDTIDYNSVSNPSCPAGQKANIDESINWAIYADFYSKIPCSGLSNDTDPYPIMHNTNNVTFYVTSVHPFRLPSTQINNTGNIVPSNDDLFSNSTTNSTSGDNSDSDMKDIVIWSSLGTGLIIIAIVILMFVIKKGKKK